MFFGVFWCVLVCFGIFVLFGGCFCAFGFVFVLIFARSAKFFGVNFFAMELSKMGDCRPAMAVEFPLVFFIYFFCMFSVVV